MTSEAEDLEWYPFCGDLCERHCDEPPPDVCHSWAERELEHQHSHPKEN